MPDGEFARLIQPHQAQLRLHCYRMLGSSHDSDDMMQETLTRAFRSMHTLGDPGAVRGWLHRIATNVCLDELAKRPKPRSRGPELGPAGRPSAEIPPATPDEEWIEPLPSAWLAGETNDPATSYSLKESVALAFVAALQVLTASQRAVLLLRDVVGLSAEETAAALDCTVTAANSTLHRARVAVEERVGPRQTWSPDERAPVDRALLGRYMRAWESGDLDAIVTLLHEDATLSMPPFPAWFAGRRDIESFYRVHLAAPLAHRIFRGRIVEVGGDLGVAFYRRMSEGSERADLFAIQAVEMAQGCLRVLDHFMSSATLAPFLASGVAPSVPLK